MYEGHSLAVVVPAHNEAGFIRKVLDTVPAYVDRIYVVDDCSTDGTWERIREYIEDNRREASSHLEPGGPEPSIPAQIEEFVSDGGRPIHERIVPVRHDTNRGRGGAIKTGYRLALADGVDIVAVMDGDGQMDPDILDEIVDPVAAGEADYAKGNRLGNRADRAEMSGWRLFGNVLLTVLTKVASGYWRMRDPQNGYTAVSREALETVDLANLYEGYGFLNDMLIRLNHHDLAVVDIPMEAVYGEESSGIQYSTFVPKLSLLLLRGFLWRLWNRVLVSSEDRRATTS